MQLIDPIPSPDLPPGGGDAGEEAPLPVRSGWVRQSLDVPELERLLGGPIGARISDNFDSLRVRFQKLVERIGGKAEATCEEIRRRAGVMRGGVLVSAFLGISALIVAFVLPAYRVPATLIALAELVLVLTLSFLQRRLARDLLAADAWGMRFRAPLLAARTPDDLHRLGDRIRHEAEEVIGKRAAGAALAEGETA